MLFDSTGNIGSGSASGRLPPRCTPLVSLRGDDVCHPRHEVNLFNTSLSMLKSFSRSRDRLACIIVGILAAVAVKEFVT